MRATLAMGNVPVAAVARLAALVALVCVAAAAGGASASEKPPDWQRSRSVYFQLPADRQVDAHVTLLRASLSLAQPDRVFVQSTGTYRPIGSSAANVYIAVDGIKVSNDSLVDWRASTRPTAHPFDAVGALQLRAGRHVVELVAEPVGWLPLCVDDDCRPDGVPAASGSFVVSAGANLSVLVHPAESIRSNRLSADVGPFDLKTAGLLTPDNNLTGPLPFASLLSATVPARKPAVALGSGWVYSAVRNSSDAMLAFLVDGRFAGNAGSSWANQDLWHGAEQRGPLSTQAFLPVQGRARRVSLATVEYPWAPTWVPGQPDNPTVYSVARGTGMTVLIGGMKVLGSATSSYDDSPNSNSSWIGVGSSSGDPYSQPVGTNVELAKAVVRVPRGHSGVVMFSAKSRTHGGDNSDTGYTSSGTLAIWITIDGRPAGPRVFQTVEAPESASQRSIAVSYLASGRRALRPGAHRVQLWGRADGSFHHAWMWRDLPLIWFD